MKNHTTTTRPVATPRRPQRGIQNTTLNVSLPKELRASIQEIADHEGHTLSSWIRFKLTEVVRTEMHS